MRGVAACLMLLLAAVRQACSFTPGVDGPVSDVSSVEGTGALLRCDTSPGAPPHDQLMLLVWYKDNAPVYSYDARVPSEWVLESFNRSGRVRSSGGGGELTIAQVRLEDQALYHCRVDFQLSPTRNIAVNLTVIELPSQPFFLDEVGNKVEGEVGPYHEGDNLVLSCLVIGGRPPPMVRWYSDNVLVDATDAPSEIPGVRENELFLPLAREHASGPLVCEASNTNLVPPLRSTLLLELYLPVESVEVSWVSGARRDGTLEAGQHATAQCRARGAHPQPDITWWLDHRQLIHHHNQSWSSESATAVSYLTLTPSRADDGAALSCVATNVVMAPNRGSRSHVLMLTVLYVPAVEVVKLGLGRENETAEGSMLRLRCDIEANPPYTSLHWFYNDSELNPTEPSELWRGAEFPGEELALALVSRRHSGLYACSAENPRGAARSEDLQISVLYPPECRGAGVSLVAESVVCDVEALPAPDTYLWRVRGAGDLQQVTSAAPLLRLSLLQGSLDAPLQLSCEAVNTVASQRSPCQATFSLKHLRPAPPVHCDMSYEFNAFYVHCQPGGNATYHVLSVWRMSASNASLALAWRARSPAGLGGSERAVGGALGALGEGDEAGVAACNSYGCSSDTLLRPSAALLYAAQPPWWKGLFEKDFGISVGIVVIIAVFVVSSLLLTRLLGRFSRGKPLPPPPVIQVLQLDDFTAREYLDTLDRSKRSLKSCSSSLYTSRRSSLETLDAPYVDRARKPPAPLPGAPGDLPPRCWEHLDPPDITAQLHRESAV